MKKSVFNVIVRYESPCGDDDFTYVFDNRDSAKRMKESLSDKFMKEKYESILGEWDFDEDDESFTFWDFESGELLNIEINEFNVLESDVDDEEIEDLVEEVIFSMF